MTRTGRGGPLIGREGALEELWSRVASCVEGGLRVAVLRGPAGIGKTRVLEAFAARARSNGATVLMGRAPVVAPYPFATLADLLGGYARSSVSALAEIRRAGDALVRLVPAHAHESDEDIDQLATIQALYRLIEHISSRRPVVVVVDDIHAVDAQSCEALAALSRHADVLPWVLTLGLRDPAPVMAAPRRLMETLRRESDVTEVLLAPLQRSEVGQVVAALLGDGLPSPSLVDMVHQRTVGNPLHVEEIVHWLQETGQLERHGLQWSARAGASGALPPGIEDSLRERMAPLTVLEGAVLDWLAVVGEAVELSMLATLTAAEAGDLGRALESLRDDGLVQEEGERPCRYRVHHPLIAECRYADMSEARRVEAHHAVAAELAARGAAADQVAAHLTRVAEHGDEQALDAALAAASAAEQGMRYAQAMRWYRAAADLVAPDDSERRLHILDRISDIGSHAGDIVSGIAAVTSLLDIAGDDPARRVELLRRLAALRSVSGDAQGARSAIDEGLRLARSAGPAAAALLAELATVATHTLGIPEVRAIIARGVEVCEAAGPAATESLLTLRALDALAVSDSGRPREGLALATSAGEEAMAGGHVLQVGYATFAAGVSNLCLGHFREAAESLGALSELVADNLGIAWGAAWSLSCQGEALFYLGDLDAGLSCSLRGEEIARRGGALGVLPLPITTAAIILATQGKSGPAHQRLQEAHRLLDGREVSISEGWYWHATSMVAVIDRDYVEAVHAIERLDTVAEARGEGWLHSFAPDHVNTLVSAGHVDAARARGERMLVTLSDAGIEYAAIALRAALARVEAASGNPSAAAELAVRAADEAETIDGTFLPAMVRSYAGEALLAAGRRALACEILIDASARLATIGVVWRAAEVTMLLGAAGVNGAAPGAVDAARAAGPLDVLSERERSVAQLAGRGMRSRSIGVTLSISERTVENHLANVYAKLGIRSRAQLIALCADGTAP